MKLCQTCGQPVAEEITTCPNCGSDVGEGIQRIDDYLIAAVLHEGYSSILCRAFREGTEEPVMVRIFTPDSGVDEKVADRLKRELEELKKLPEEYFVRHLEIKRSSEGVWYRVSEWVDAQNNADISSGQLDDTASIVDWTSFYYASDPLFNIAVGYRWRLSNDMAFMNAFRTDFSAIKNGMEIIFESKGRKYSGAINAAIKDVFTKKANHASQSKYGVVSHLPRNNLPAKIIIIVR